MKKNIDSFFKNKLDVPKQTPDNSWDYIQKHLPPEEDDKRLIPFFGQKTMGIALLFMGLLGGGLIIVGKGVFNQDLFGEHQKAVSFNKNDGNQNSANTNEANDANKIADTNAVYNQNRNNPSDSASGETPVYSNEQYGTAPYYVASALNQSNSHFINYSSNNSNNTNYSNQNSTAYNSSAPFIVQENSLLDLLNRNHSKNNNIAVWDPEINLNGNSELMAILSNSQDNLSSSNSEAKNEKASQKKIKPKMDFDKFYISGFVSPTGLNTFVGSSMLSDGLNNYKTENTIALAYGLKTAYSLNPKLRLRTGVSVVDFEQITKNVLFSANLSESTVQPTVDTKNNIKYSGELRLFDQSSNSELNYRISDGDVQQQTRFIEIPVEAELSVFQTGSIGISVTGGASTWLLSKNKIYAQTNGHTEELGKADNLNKTSFSANAGLKFDMQLSEGIKLNVEPSFKYLINPVSNIEKYSPYTVGVNAGVTVRIK